MSRSASVDRVLAEVERARDELVDFAAELIRIPTVNPPGENYRECAETIGARLGAWGMEVEYVEAEGRAEHTSAHPRVNVIGRLAGAGARPCLHLNGHFDVVPAGGGWTVDPFGGLVREGRLFGRGASDMKSGLAAAAFAVEAIRRAGAELRGSMEVSGTVDEESGGFAGVAYLCEAGHIASDRIDYAIIPEPFGPERICVGHKGVYWFDVIAHGQIAHGSMPHLGRNAICDMAALIDAVASRLGPELAQRVTAMPVVPEASRRASINVNAVAGGQAGQEQQSSCVADRCVATFDRRFIAEESYDEVRAEVVAIVRQLEAEQPGRRYTIEDRMVVNPVQTPDGSPVVAALSRAVARVRGSEASLVGSPGTYDHKHFARIAGVEHCVAYGPGPLEEAHQPDESCSIDDLVASSQVMALAALELVGC
ncbi:MAG: acetylornithine deacetylase/succinyl-diaminopimelate desuccinylase family protein [Gemmatimonadetes bacterium]|nr:acetylornithine deacetylase/succinyl-diaminopimelate desuccinylase family protein [Gemmatimonadota bacterium]